MDKKLYKKIGIEVYSTKTPGIGGLLKQEPLDFIVQEISQDGTVCGLEPAIPQSPTMSDMNKSNNSAKSLIVPPPTPKEWEYTHFTLVKRDWNQAQIIKKIAKAAGQSRKRLSYAGTKDKKALTSQRVSAWKITPEQLAQISIKDCKIGDFSYENYRLELGNLWGNLFTVLIKDVKKPENLEKILEEFKKLNGLPNFFGEQRFGLRLNNPIIGKEILKENIEKAIKHFLTDTIETELEEGRKAREFLGKNWGDFKQALKLYPNFMRFERALLDRLNRYPKDYVGAFKQLSKNTYKIFTHAYQSYLFNKILSNKIKNKEKLNGTANLIGYETKPSEFEKKILKKEDLEINEFKVKAFPEASVKGQERNLLANLEILDHKFNGNSLTLKFKLEKGAYATTFLREIIK